MCPLVNGENPEGRWEVLGGGMRWSDVGLCRHKVDHRAHTELVTIVARAEKLTKGPVSRWGWDFKCCLRGLTCNVTPLPQTLQWLPIDFIHYAWPTKLLLISQLVPSTSATLTFLLLFEYTNLIFILEASHLLVPLLAKLSLSAKLSHSCCLLVMEVTL